MRITRKCVTINLRSNRAGRKERGEILYQEIDWNTVTIRNNFLFQETLRNERLCKYFLNHVLHIQVNNIRYLETEKTMTARLSSKYTRLDLYVEDKNGNVSDIEMQVTGSKSVMYNDLDEATVIRELPLRVRYYQSMISTNMLRKGVHYRNMKKAFVIFVCTFDPFGEGLPAYHFTYRCKEKRDLQMGDLTENIYLNTTAADKADDEELAAFLRYVNTQKTTSDFTKELDEEATRIRNNDDWRLRIMTLDMEIQDMKRRTAIKERAEGKAEGLKEGKAAGLREGKAEGLKEGKAEGKAEGRKERTNEIVRKMRAEGMNDALIARLTELSETEVAAIA